MKLNFFGATETVTGSKYMLEVENKKYLIDCGMFQGLKHLREKNRRDFPFKPSEISAVFLTHAHIDHSGLLPLLVKNGYSGPIFCTLATRRLCEILLLDSAHLQEEDAAYANRKGFSKHSPAQPLFNSYDVEKTMRCFQTIAFGQTKRIDNINVSYHAAGHILGAASIYIEHKGRHICFSGDLGRRHDQIMSAPSPLTRADILVCESTYGDRNHPAENTDDFLANIVNETLKNSGTILIPAFAVGRAQLLLKILVDLIKNRKIPPTPIYLDSPMAIRATELFSEHLGEHKLNARDIADIKRTVTFVSDAKHSKALTQNNEPKIIISASGMATGGRILHHLKEFLPYGNNSVVLAGFQAAGTRGDSLSNGAEYIKIHGEMVSVNAKVYQMQGVSAHADKSEIISWINDLRIPPRKLFLTHGEPKAIESLRVALRDRFQIEATVPEYGENYEI